MTVLAWSWSFYEFDRAKKLFKLSFSIFISKDSPVIFRCFVWALTQFIIVTDWVSDSIGIRGWALLFQCRCFEPVLSLGESKPSIFSDRAGQRLTNLFHIRVSRLYLIPCLDRAESAWLSESDTTLGSVEHVRVIENWESCRASSFVLCGSNWLKR